MLHVRETTVDYWVEMLSRRLPFTFSRWGDGEWHSVLGRTHGKNCDGHDYFPAMGKALKSVLLSRPTYTLGLQPLARRLFTDKLPGGVDQWIEEHSLDTLDWINADVLHQASGKRCIDAFFASFRGCPSVVVGPPHLRRLKDLLGYRKFIDVPPRNSYLALDDLFSNTMGALEDMPTKCLVSVSAGMPGKLLIDSLHRRHGGRILLLDAGSLFDVYAGIKSRRYMQDMDVAVPDRTRDNE